MRQNTPKYFAPSEERDYLHYLENEIDDYFVFATNSDIIGAGGCNYDYNKKRAYLAWGIVHPNWQKQGVGTA